MECVSLSKRNMWFLYLYFMVSATYHLQRRYVPHKECLLVILFLNYWL